MCLQCHQGISDETILQQFKESLTNPHFEMWNSTSLNHIFIGLLGVNGREVQAYSDQLIVNLLAWSRTKYSLSYRGFVIALHKNIKDMPNWLIKTDEEKVKRKDEVFHNDLLTNMIKEVENEIGKCGNMLK